MSEHLWYERWEGERKDGDGDDLQAWCLWNLEVEDVVCQVGDKVILQGKVRRGAVPRMGWGKWRMLGIASMGRGDQTDLRNTDGGWALWQA